MSAFDLIDEYGLTLGQARVLAALAEGRLDKAGIVHLAQQGRVTERTTVVLVTQLKRILGARGVRISTVRENGYTMDAASCAVVMNILNRGKASGGVMPVADSVAESAT